MANTKAKVATDLNPETEAQLDGSSQEGESVNDQALSLQETTGQLVTKNEGVMQDFVNWLVAAADTTDDDQYALMASIVAEIRQATNPEEVLRERSALHVRDILNTPLIIHGFEIRAGDYEDSELNFYAAITCGRQGREDTRIVTCGATKVLAKLWVLQDLGEWPHVVWFTGKQTSKGFTSFDMVSPTI
jgi:hypothetical protein